MAAFAKEEAVVLALVVRLRPVLLITFYGLLCLISSRATGVLSGYMLVGIVALLLFLTFPAFNMLMLGGQGAPEAVQVVVNAAAVSQLALTLNTGSLIVGFDLHQRFAWR